MKRIRAAALAALLLSGGVSCAKSGRKDAMLYIGHRGLPSAAFESTPLSWTRAAENSAFDAIETDLHLTKDNYIVCVHDNQPFRGTHQSVRELTYEETRRYPLHISTDFAYYHEGDYYLPLFDEFLEIAKQYNKIAVFEIKEDTFTDDDLRAVIQKVQAAGLENKCVINSFIPSIVERLRVLVPAWMKLEVLLPYDDDTSQEIVKTWIDAGCNVSVGDKDSAESSPWGITIIKELVDYIHEHKKTISVWTVDSKKRAKELDAMGVDAIFTNYAYADGPPMPNLVITKKYIAGSNGTLESP